MNKDFPSALFETLANKAAAAEAGSSRDLYAEKEILTNLNYTHPIAVNFDEFTKQPKVLTQMFYADDCLDVTTPIMPWSMPSDLKKSPNYDIYYEMAEKIAQITQSKLYYLATCKSTRAKFFPSLLSKSNQGKCFFTADGIWLTPIEFQAYSGSTSSDWKATVILNSPGASDTRVSRKRKKQDQLSIKKLVQSKVCKIHSFNCECEQCYKAANNLQSENLNILSSFFMNNGQNLITLYPNSRSQHMIDLNNFKIQTDTKSNTHSIADLLLSVSGDSNPKNKSKQTLNLNDRQSNKKIKQIQCKSNDQDTYHGEPDVTAETVVSVNLSNSCVQTFLLQLTETECFRTKLLYEVQSDNDSISCMRASHLTEGDCAVLLEKSGDIHLLTEANCNLKSFEDPSSLKIASGLASNFGTKNLWKNVYFGAQPRQFVYSDCSQVISIDSRIKTLCNSHGKEIFKVSLDDLDIDELVMRTQIADNDYFCHLVCCSKTFLVIDERYTKQPVLSWKHNLTMPAVYLEDSFIPSSGQFNPTGKDYSHFALLSDSRQTYAYQYSTKHDMYMSFNFPLRLDSPIDMIGHLPESYDKRLLNHLKHRLNEPVVGFNTLKYSNSFALFQLLPSYDLLFECFDVNRPNRNKIDTNATICVYENWINELQFQALTDINSSLESDFNDMSLRDQNVRNQPNSEIFYVPCTSNKDLKKYLNIREVKNGNLNLEHPIFKYEYSNKYDEKSQNELTRSLFEVWND